MDTQKKVHVNIITGWTTTTSCQCTEVFHSFSLFLSLSQPKTMQSLSLGFITSNFSNRIFRCYTVMAISASHAGLSTLVLQRLPSGLFVCLASPQNITSTVLPLLYPTEGTSHGLPAGLGVRKTTNYSTFSLGVVLVVAQRRWGRRRRRGRMLHEWVFFYIRLKGRRLTLCYVLYIPWSHIHAQQHYSKILFQE